MPRAKPYAAPLEVRAPPGAGGLSGASENTQATVSAQPGGNRLGGVLDHGAGRGAAEVHRRGQPQIAQAKRLLQLERAHALVVPADAGIEQQAVQVAALEPGVVEREAHGFDRETRWRSNRRPCLAV